MKPILYIGVVLLLICVCAIDAPGFGQPTARNTRGRSDPGQSHQMNQPRPETAKRVKFSKELIQEIRRLYLQAKKELETKNREPKTRP